MINPGLAPRYEIAWRIWCWQEGYTNPEDRAILANWLGDSDDELTENDIKTRDALLSIADEVIALNDSFRREPHIRTHSEWLQKYANQIPQEKNG